MKAKLDAYLSKWLSRKLKVFLIGCAALFTGKLDSNDWVIIGTAYIAFQGATDIVERLMKVRIPKQTEVTENTPNAK